MRGVILVYQPCAPRLPLPHQQPRLHHRGRRRGELGIKSTGVKVGNKLRVAGEVDIFVQLTVYDAEFPRMTLEMEDVTLREAIESAAKQCGMEVVYEPGKVVLRPKD